MAISAQPESVGATATVQSDSDLNQSSLRRRPSVTLDALEGESSGEELVRDSGSDDSMNSKSSDHNSKSALNFDYRPCFPAHRRVKESPLSSGNIFRQSHAGLFNLCIVVLASVNSRLIIENLMKYGWLIKSGFWFSSKSFRDWPLFMCCLALATFPLAAFIVEKLAQQKCISEPVVVLLHIIITTSAILYPVLVMLRPFAAVARGGASDDL